MYTLLHELYGEYSLEVIHLALVDGIITPEEHVDLEIEWDRMLAEAFNNVDDPNLIHII